MHEDPTRRDPLDLHPCACDHGGITQGRHGDTRGRSWCIACGGLVLEAHDRPCSECRHFKRDIGFQRIGRCAHPTQGLMSVTDNMLVTYYVAQIDRPGRYGLCFEAAE